MGDSGSPIKVSYKVVVKMSVGASGLTGAKESTSKVPHMADGKSPQFFAM